MKHKHSMPFGAAPRSGGGVDFSIWAPAAHVVHLAVNSGLMPVDQRDAGWWHTYDPSSGPGTEYRWVIDRDLFVPDPASRSNPKGPDGPSVVVDPSDFEWTCAWDGRPWNESVMYQLHVGTFTPEGTYASAMARLQDLAELGVTVVQLMPLASFGGDYGWGYDGVLLFAPNPVYGTVDELKAFVDEAHRQCMSVFIDVVYNHFGPEGNALHRYAPQFETQAHKTPWGGAVNFDGPDSKFVREFFIHNALYWVQEFRFDGIRVDAVHAMLDDGPMHIVEEITRRIRAIATGRKVHVVLENDHNNPTRLGLAPELADGQWNGDFHHCMHVLLTGETRSYYAEYADDPIARLGRVLTLGFSRDGADEERADRPPRRDATSTLALQNAVDFLQCHDQIGNRAFGERLNMISPAEGWRLASAMLLLGPSIPMMFMGEEFDSKRPFFYFADVEPGMRDKIRAGRREEFRDAPDGGGAERGTPPDPCIQETRDRSVIEQPDEYTPEQRDRLEWTRLLLRARRQMLSAAGGNLDTGRHAWTRWGRSGLHVAWRYGSARLLNMAVNLDERPLELSESLPSGSARVLSVGTVRDRLIGGWSGLWWWS